ncbi:unnamed protein product [Strongylus vulgaris]|uniref:Reverse transcriptase domain-containing protein n=1 Tax=Strongylus vulgaris TaxID=40348 RepID=A0A3P7JLI9_STRVU|nr:unnamed protein product [Strongylus vulgaris]
MKTMLKGLNEVAKRIGLRVTRNKTQFMEERFLQGSGNGIRGIANRGDVFVRISWVFDENGERFERRTKQEAKSSLGHFGPQRKPQTS